MKHKDPLPFCIFEYPSRHVERTDPECYLEDVDVADPGNPALTYYTSKHFQGERRVNDVRLVDSMLGLQQADSC